MSWEPKYIKASVDYQTKQTITAQEFNNLLNLLQTQGDNNTDGLVDLYDKYGTVDGLTFSISEVETVSGKATADLTVDLPNVYLSLGIPKGEAGDPFVITKIYSSVSEMEAAFSESDVEVGQFVLINTGDVNDDDNAKLYVKGEASFEYLVDMSGSTGLPGADGEQGEQGYSISRVELIDGTSEAGTQDVYGVYLNDSDSSLVGTFIVVHGYNGSLDEEGSIKIASNEDVSSVLQAVFDGSTLDSSLVLAGSLITLEQLELFGEKVVSYIETSETDLNNRLTTLEEFLSLEDSDVLLAIDDDNLLGDDLGYCLIAD